MVTESPRRKKLNNNKSGKKQARHDKRYYEAVARAKFSYQDAVKQATEVALIKFPDKKDKAKVKSYIEEDPIVKHKLKNLITTTRKEDRK